MSRLWLFGIMLAGGQGLVVPDVAPAQQPARVAPPTSAELLAQTRRFTRTTTVSDCMAEAADSDDIVVCGARTQQPLPVPEVYGPVRGSTDGAAVNPAGIPCSASISNQCYSGIDLPRLASATIGIAALIIDPDRNLGEGERIPQRFRGANR